MRTLMQPPYQTIEAPVVKEAVAAFADDDATHSCSEGNVSVT